MINDLVSDIKPDNILLTSNQSLQIKLADFGISKIFEETVKLKTGAGTPGI
jgi:serine/threonine protein kinase